MPEDRLRKDEDRVRNLDDLIEARSEGTRHFADDRDSLETDLDIPDDLDVQDALTFPHSRKASDEHDGIPNDLPRKDDMEDDQEDWQESNMLPSDYSDDYDDALTVFPSDDEDEVVEEAMRDISRVRLGDMSTEPEIERMPNVFTPDGATGRVEASEGSTDPEEIGLIIADEHTRGDARNDDAEE